MKRVFTGISIGACIGACAVSASPGPRFQSVYIDGGGLAINAMIAVTFALLAIAARKEPQ